MQLLGLKQIVHLLKHFNANISLKFLPWELMRKLEISLIRCSKEGHQIISFSVEICNIRFRLVQLEKRVSSMI